VGGAVLGLPDFVNWIRKTFLTKDSDSREIPQLRILKSRPAPEDLVQEVSAEFDCERESILRKGEKRNLARDVSIYLCREMTGETGVALGRYFGGVTGAAIAMKHGQVANRIETDRKLKGRITQIRKKILNI